VRGQEVLLADVVQRGDERQRPEGDRKREERCSVPAGVILSASAAETDERLPEERQCERCARENRDRRLPGRGDRLVMVSGMREDQGAARTWPSTQSPVKV
jgi:hypothetical protein